MVCKHSEPLLLSQVLNILVLTFISEAANSNAHRSQVAMHMKRWASWGLWQTRECLSCLNKQVLLGPTTYCYMEHRPTKAFLREARSHFPQFLNVGINTRLRTCTYTLRRLNKTPLQAHQCHGVAYLQSLSSLRFSLYRSSQVRWQQCQGFNLAFRMLRIPQFGPNPSLPTFPSGKVS